MRSTLYRGFVVLLCALIFGLAAGVRAVAAVPSAPTPIAPADGANVTVPFTISWSPVSDPNGVIGYNWQVSPSATFSPVILQDSRDGQTTQDVVSGLANGTYFWRVQAANGAFEQGVWSAPQSFTVTGAGASSPGTPTLAPTRGYSTFHPAELINFDWSIVPGAASYVLQYSNDPSFPLGLEPSGIITGTADNIPTNTYGFVHRLAEGTWYTRVRAVSAEGIVGRASNVISYTVFYTNPVPPPPVLVSPVGNPTLTLPFALRWEHVINPQPSGYEVQIASDPQFTTNEAVLGVQLTEPLFNILTLTPGAKFWRVRSHQGMSSPTTTAPTAWSATGTFTLSTAPATPVSIAPLRLPLYSGDDTFVAVQLTAGVPPGGATVALTSSNPNVAPVPPTLAIRGNDGWTQFQMQVGQVTVPTPVTLTATLNGVTAAGQFTVLPPALKSLTITPLTISGGTEASGIVMLNGQAPAGGAVVNLASNSPAATPPALVTVPAGSYSAPFTIPTSNVTTNTPATITANWNGGTAQTQMTVVPGPAPTSFTLFPATVVGGGAGSVDGLVTIASPAPFDQFLQVTSNNPTVLPFLSKSVTIPAGTTRGAIQVITTSVSTQTIVTISVTGGGVTRAATLTVNPAGTPPPPTTLASFSVSPTSVVGGNPATGTVTLPSPAPAGGTVVTLSSMLPATASVPASVTIPAGTTSASFTITTFPNAGTVVQLSARLVDSILFAQLAVNPPAPPKLSAPALLSPADKATVAQPITFDWSDVTAAVSYTIQIDVKNSFPSPLLTASTVNSTSQFTTGALPIKKQLWWRVRGVNSAGVAGPWSAVRSFTPQSSAPPPPAPATLSTLTLNTTSVVGSNAAQGSVTLTGAAPTGGALVTLASSNAGVVSVPPSVTIAAGATGANFTLTSSSVTTATTVSVSATYGGVTRTATLTVMPPSPPLTQATLTVSASGRSGERVTSSPAGINVPVGSNGSASFTTGTSITLSVTNGRDAIWAGACSSGGNKTKTCRLTLTGNATVTANVQ